METLKRRHEIKRPDVRNTYFVVTREYEKAARLTLDDIHSSVSNIRLGESVPEAVRSHFAQAQNLAVYSWFYYPFNVTAQFMAFVSVEFALKSRYQSRAPFKKLIRRAIDEGAIRDEGFAIVKHRETPNPPYVEVLYEVLPKLRNELAHGTHMLHNNSLSSLRTSADFINQLFGGHAA